MTIVDIPSIGITQLSMFDASIVGSSRLGSSSWSVVKSHVPWWFYGYYPILSKISGSYQNPSESTGKSVATRQEVNEGCVEEWSAQLGEALELLRSLRPQGAKVNVSCQMGPLVLGGPGWMGLGKHEGPDWPEMATFSKTNGCEATCIVVRRTMVPTRLSRALRIFQVLGIKRGGPMVSEWKVTSRSLKTHQERHGKPPKLVVLLGDLFILSRCPYVCVSFSVSKGF